MTRFHRILGPLALIGLIIVTLVQASGVTAQSGQPSLPHKTPRHTPQHGRGPLFVPPTSNSAGGIPAIHPHSVANSPATPDFTVEDVQAYLLLTASVPKLTPVQGAHLTIEEVSLISSKEATQRMGGESPGLPDDAQVCFVLVKGPFHVQIDAPPGYTGSADPIATEVGVVFDAHTGNLLEWAVLDAFQASSPAQAASQSPGRPTVQLSAAHLAAPSISYSCMGRCHGTNYWPNQVHGAYTFLNWAYPGVTPLYMGNQYVQNTMWLEDQNEAPSVCPGVCWVEAGLRAIHDPYNASQNRTWLFWADLRPNHPYAEHYGAIVNTLTSTCCIEIRIWKAGTIPNIGWCPTATSEWCVDVYSDTDQKDFHGISGANHTNTMTTTGYRVGLELYGTSGAIAGPMFFDDNLWESANDNSWNYQTNAGDRYGYVNDNPVDSGWDYAPAPGNNGGQWFTCITNAGC